MIPTSYVLALSAILFTLGFFGVILRRNAIVVMMSVELMLNASIVAIMAFSHNWGSVTGHGLAFLIIAIAAAEAALGLAIVVAIFRTRGTIHLDEIRTMKG